MFERSYSDLKPSETDISIYVKSLEWKKSIESLVSEVADDYAFICDRREIFENLEDVEKKGSENIGYEEIKVIPKLLERINKISYHYFISIRDICPDLQEKIVGNEYFDDFFNSYKALMGLANRKVNEGPCAMTELVMNGMRKRLKSSNNIYDRIIGNK